MMPASNATVIADILFIASVLVERRKRTPRSEQALREG
jgi:hypothetical protein